MPKGNSSGTWFVGIPNMWHAASRPCSPDLALHLLEQLVRVEDPRMIEWDPGAAGRPRAAGDEHVGRRLNHRLAGLKSAHQELTLNLSST